MPIVGTVQQLDVDLEVWGPDTQVTIMVKPPEGPLVDAEAVPVAPPAPEQARKKWRGTVEWSMPGIWTVYPSVEGTGYGVGDPYRVSVGPADQLGDTRHTYATSRGYAEVTGEAPPLDVDRLLRDASQQVDDVLHFAVYDVDDAGMPTRAEHAEALKLATVEVVRWWDANGWDGSGAEGQVQSASIAGVSLGFASGKQGGRLDLLGDKARRILSTAGLLGGSASAPITY